jgi:hypothetical protein
VPTDNGFWSNNCQGAQGSAVADIIIADGYLQLADLAGRHCSDVAMVAELPRGTTPAAARIVRFSADCQPDQIYDRDRLPCASLSGAFVYECGKIAQFFILSYRERVDTS